MRAACCFCQADGSATRLLPHCGLRAAGTGLGSDAATVREAAEGDGTAAGTQAGRLRCKRLGQAATNQNRGTARRQPRKISQAEKGPKITLYKEYFIKVVVFPYFEAAHRLQPFPARCNAADCRRRKMKS
eukprot:6214631-Pleurochrysis_carterae.AAC.3